MLRARTPVLALMFLAVLPLTAWAYTKPKVKKGTRPAGAPADNRYYDIEVRGIDENNPLSRVYIETDDNMTAAAVTSNGAGGIPAGWTHSIATVGDKKFLCFSRGDDTEGNTTFKICVAPVGGKKARVGSGDYKLYKKSPTGHTPVSTGSSSTGKIYFVSVLPPDFGGASSPGTLLATGLSADTIIIADPLPIADLQIEVDLLVEDVGAIAVDITSPSGITVRLHDHLGSPEPDLWRTYSALGQPPTGSDLPGAELFPSGPGSLSDFAGEPGAGEWQLTIENASPDLGYLNRWEIRNYLEPAARPVRELTCAADAASETLFVSWSPAPGLPLESIHVIRNGVEETVLDPFTLSYVVSGVSGVQEIVVESHAFVGKIGESVCRVAVSDAHVVCAGEGDGGLIESATELASALALLGEPVLEVDVLQLDTVGTAPRAVWVVNGTYPNNHVMTADEGALLAELNANGVPVYVESGDGWGFDPMTPFHTIDGIDDLAVSDGDDSFLGMIGADFDAAQFGGLAAEYVQDSFLSDWTDRLVADSSGDAAAVWSDDGSGGSTAAYDTGVFRRGDDASAPVLSQSWEFGGYLGDKIDLADRYLDALFGSAPVPDPQFRRGDLNQDGGFNLADAIFGLSALFGGSVEPACLDAADVNDDGLFNIGDSIFVLNQLFGGSAPPVPAPFDSCGVDLTVDALDCASFDPCL